MARRPVPRRQVAASLPQKEVKALTSLIEHQDYAAAERRAMALLKRYPAASQAHLLLAQVLLKRTRYLDAETAYREAKRLAPGSLDAWLGLAHSLTLQRKHGEALELVKQALKHAPKLAAVWVTLGNIQKETHELEAAVASYTKALEFSPDDWKIYRALAHLITFDSDSPVFGLLKKHLEDERYSPRDRADMNFVLGKAYLDIQADEQAFQHYQEANRLMDESLPPIRAELEKRLTFTRRRFTRRLFEEMSQVENCSCPQIIVAGMSRAGKSLVESLFRGVKGVSLAGEKLVLGEYTRERLDRFDGKLDQYLAHLNPVRLRDDAQGYRERLGDGETIKVTTVPGDLWNLGLVGLWAPQVPIIFCVRNLLDLGATGYFHQYQVPEGFRYSYNLEQLGRQIACSEKIMDHWAQVLPNPVYLVDYEALTANPEQVMGNLLCQLGLEREISYAEVVGKNAAMLEGLSPVESSDAPMPVVSRFNGFAERFRDKLHPLIKGYQTIADAFPRLADPAVFDQPLPETWRQSDDTQPGDANNDFDWRLKGSVTVLDNGAYLLREGAVTPLLNSGAIGLVAFDPLNEVALDQSLQHHPNLQYIPNALLGSGEPATVNACLQQEYSSTLAPLANDRLPVALHGPMRVLTRYPINTVALDAIEGLASIDWLILDGRHDSVTVLERGIQALAKTLLLHVQIPFQPRYERQPNLAELQHWAARNGFQFYRFVEFQYGSPMEHKPALVKQPEATELCQATALFIPEQQRIKALDEAQRQKLGFVLDTFYDIHDLTYQLLAGADVEQAEQYLRARDYYNHAKLEPPTQEVEEVAALLASGQPVQAGQYLAAWRRRYPASSSVRWLRAQAALLGHQDELAFIQMEKALDLAPDRLELRARAIQLLLEAEMWWEAWRLADVMISSAPTSYWVMRAYVDAVVEHPSPPESAVKQAQHCLDQLSDSSSDLLHAVERLTLQARLEALRGEVDAGLALHKQALDAKVNCHPGVAAWAWLQAGHTWQLAGDANSACEHYWQATQVTPQTRRTSTAAHCLDVALAEADRYAPLAALHQQWRELKQTHKSDAQLGRFGLPRQGLGRLLLPGNRSSEARIEAYGVLDWLPENAKVLDIQAEQGAMLLALAPYIAAGTGLHAGEFDHQAANAMAAALKEAHLTFVQETFENATLARTFDLVLACGAHDSLDMTPEELGERLHKLCAEQGRVLLESRGTSNPKVVEPGFESLVQRIADAGFNVEAEGTLCDDGINLRVYKVLKKQS